MLVLMLNTGLEALFFDPRFFSVESPLAAFNLAVLFANMDRFCIFGLVEAVGDVGNTEDFAKIGDIFPAYLVPLDGDQPSSVLW